MKYCFGLLALGLFLFSCKQTPTSTSIKPADILQAIVGEYDNFQQCWQENTQEGKHKVETNVLHKHIHTVIRKTKHNNWLYIKHFEGRDSSKVVAELGWQVSKAKEELLVEEYPWKENLPKVQDLPAPNRKFSWEKEGASYKAKIGEDIWIIKGDTLHIQGSEESLFANEEAYRLLRCRFFSGWIEYPLPQNPDSTYRMGNLRIHDQGGIVPLILGDGTPTDFSAELTQLVYGRQLSIMKLAIYKEPFENIHYNSRSISYTWTTPEAKRAGINLRTISSGWTFIEPGYLSSNNMKKK